MSSLIVRPFEPRDLAAALALQGQVYPAFLIEPAEAFASRLGVAAPYSLVAERDGALLGYLLAHGAPAESPAPVGAVLGADYGGAVLFLHDLALSPASRGEGLGRLLVDGAFARAAADGLRMAELIAVEGAASYWRRLGFAETPTSPALAAKVAGYGAEARWMTRAF